MDELINQTKQQGRRHEILFLEICLGHKDSTSINSLKQNSNISPYFLPIFFIWQNEPNNRARLFISILNIHPASKQPGYKIYEVSVVRGLWMPVNLLFPKPKAQLMTLWPVASSHVCVYFLFVFLGTKFLEADNKAPVFVIFPSLANISLSLAKPDLSNGFCRPMSQRAVQMLDS